MSKAKEKALKIYPIKIAERDGYDENLRERKGFVKGYHQAEKDNELTWEDMECIIKHYQDILVEKSHVFMRVEDYQEVLKRFKDFKK